MARRVNSDEYLTDDGSVEGDGTGDVKPGDDPNGMAYRPDVNPNGIGYQPGNNTDGIGYQPGNNPSRAEDRFRQILKLPSFYHKEPIVWFAEVELLFDYVGVQTEKTKAGAVLAALDCETVMTVSDIITLEVSPPDLYSRIKQRLISTFSISSESRLRQLLKGELSGEGKPSLILSRIRNLSQDKCSDEVIKTVFLDQLPSNCRSALALSEASDINKLAELADRFMEVAGQSSSQVSTVSAENSNEALANKIDALSAKVDALSVQSRSRSNQPSGSYNRGNRSKSSHSRNFGNKNFNNNSNNRNRNFKPNNNNNQNPQLCFYHKKYGNNAHKCDPSCSRYSSFSSGN